MSNQEEHIHGQDYQPPQAGFTKQPLYPNLPPQIDTKPPYPSSQPTAPEIPLPPPYTAEAQPPQQQPVVTLIQPSINYGSQAMTIICPHCHANITTKVETEANLKTHIVALLLCLFQCWFCAPCVYCIDGCLVKKHYCPSCEQYLGSCEN
ncbi:cell death-inducing p53-target protein 1 homolog [Microplitis demolitor]|uniref:cell death-inducing p53-target protein 1 homolog n=1 Tax=Microplitis demolitor TaxID=69319 RepID=UPI0004400227|nr:cell death-inducing p53-target protein 1 homolog [Microplitis demolitor]